MAYVSGRPQVIFGVSYVAGEQVPSEVVSRLRSRVVNNMITRGRLRFVEELEPVPAEPPVVELVEPTYKGSGWWEWPNGMKMRGPADRPPVLTGA